MKSSTCTWIMNCKLWWEVFLHESKACSMKVNRALRVKDNMMDEQ